MGDYAICENGYPGQKVRNLRWIVWHTGWDCEIARTETLVAAIILVAAIHGYLVEWSAMR